MDCSGCVYLLVAFGRFSAKKGWTVQRMLRALQLDLFERKALVEIFNPGPPPLIRPTSNEGGLMTVKLWGSSGLARLF
jgi:hypothetical protein